MSSKIIRDISKCRASFVYLKRILPCIVEESGIGNQQITFVEKNCKITPKNNHYVVPEIERFYPEIKMMLEKEKFKVNMIIGEYSMKEGAAPPPNYTMKVRWDE